jgi:hypothetical protein
MIEAKDFRAFIRIYSLLKSERLIAKIKVTLHKEAKIKVTLHKELTDQ